MQSLRNPERFNIMVSICLALVAAHSVAGILKRTSRNRAALIVIALSGIVLLEYWSWPFPTTQPEVPSFYHQLAAQPDNFAIVDVPISNDLSKQHMYYQTVHEKPIVTGHVSRPPQHAYDFITSSGLLHEMWQGQETGSTGNPVLDLKSLEDANVRYLIAHRDSLAEEELETLDSYLSRPPFFSDDRLIVYQIAPLP